MRKGKKRSGRDFKTREKRERENMMQNREMCE